MGINGQQRDYVIPAMWALVAVVMIVAGAVVAVSLTGREDALLLVGVLGTMAVTPIIAALVPLIKSVNRNVAASEATAAAAEATVEGVEKIRHRLNGEFSAEIRQAIADGVAPLRADIAAINARLERGDRRFDEQSREIADVKHQLEQLVSCERKPE